MTESPSPRLLTMTAEQWGDMLQFRGRPDAIRHLKAEVLAQADRVRELEQESAGRLKTLEAKADALRTAEIHVMNLETRIESLEQERERIRQALESMPHDRSCEYFYCVQCACDVRTCEHKQHGECNCGKSVLKSLPLAGERQETQTPAVVCGDCDGCGWVEGGETLQATCKTCGGTGVQPSGI